MSLGGFESVPSHCYQILANLPRRQDYSTHTLQSFWNLICISTSTGWRKDSVSCGAAHSYWRAP